MVGGEIMELLTTITLHPRDKIIDFNDISNLTEKIVFYQAQEENEYLIKNLYEIKVYNFIPRV